MRITSKKRFQNSVVDIVGLGVKGSIKRPLKSTSVCIFMSVTSVLINITFLMGLSSFKPELSIGICVHYKPQLLSQFSPCIYVVDEDDLSYVTNCSTVSFIIKIKANRCNTLSCREKFQTFREANDVLVQGLTFKALVYFCINHGFQMVLVNLKPS